MIIYDIIAILFFLGAFAYRVRGGGFFSIGSDILGRLFWGFIGLTFPYLVMAVTIHAPFEIATVGFSVWLIASAHLVQGIPHAFAMNMGNRTQTWQSMPPIPFIGSLTLSKWWPAFWLAPLLNWLNFTIQDIFGMASSCFFQGAMAFGLPMALNGTLAHFGITSGLGQLNLFDAWGIVIVGETLGYLIGRFMPTISTDLSAGPCWGEFFTGGIWILALARLLGVL